MTNRALIFAGAGASKAVNAEQFPTTVEFFDRLPETIKSNGLFQLTLDYLRRAETDRIIDIELVLWELETLRQFSDSRPQGQSFPAYAVRANRLAQLVSGQRHRNRFENSESIINDINLMCDDLIDQINSTIYQLYNYEPTPSELSDNWCFLMNSLKSAGWKYYIFTTNYDLSIEATISNIDSAGYDKFLGLSGSMKKWLDLNNWLDATEEDTLYTKLHGSIDWQRGHGKTLVGTSNFTGNHSNHAIIYPGFKGESQSDFFAPMHKYLGNRFRLADLIVFIGFAFRDEYINKLLAERVGYKARVVVINPDRAVIYPFERQHNSEYITQGFDRDSVTTALNPKKRASVRRKL
jgi:hypothetical protein